MGTSFPPEIREMMVDKPEDEDKIAHIYLEASRYFIPDTVWIQGTINRFRSQKRNVREYCLAESLRTNGNFQDSVQFHWIKKVSPDYYPHG